MGYHRKTQKKGKKKLGNLTFNQKSSSTKHGWTLRIVIFP